MADLGILDRFRLAARTLSGRLRAQDAKDIVGTFDDNAATVAYGMLSRIYGGASGEPPKRGTKEFLQAYSESPMLRAATERIATKVAMTRWRLFARKRGESRATRDFRWQTASHSERLKIRKDLQRHGEMREIEQHPFLDAMAQGNSLLTGFAVRMLGSLYADLVGENFWFKQRNGAGAPNGFWPLPPDWVAETPTPARRFFRVSHRSWTQDIPDTEILWWTVPDPANPYVRGSAVSRALSDELDTDDFVAKYTASFFHNRAAPQLMVFGDGLDKDTARQLERRWSAKYSRAENLGKPFFTNMKVDVKEVGKSFKDLELVDLRRFERDLIVSVYGVPPEVMGIIENSNRATIDAADYLMARYAVHPRIEAQREVFQQRLIPEYDDRLVLDYDSPVEEDKEFQLKVMQGKPEMFTVNDWRGLAGQPLKEDGSGDTHLVPFSVIPTQRLDQIDTGADPEAEVDDEEDIDDEGAPEPNDEETGE